MKHCYYVLIVLLFLLAGCSEKSKFSKVWFYTYNNGASATSNSSSSSKDPVLTPIHFLNLQKDGHYTCYFTDFETGTWAVENKYIVLTNDKKQIHGLLVRSISGNELNMDINPDNGDDNNYSFEGTPNPFDNTADNPFSLENNQWRIKAQQKETDQQIKQRLINHFRYWEKYFSWGLKTERTSLDVRSLPGPLKLYGNGFALLELKDMSPVWKGYFYDEEDCSKAYDMLKYFFDHENIAWPKTDNKFKQFVSAFQQLQQKL